MLQSGLPEEVYTDYFNLGKAIIRKPIETHESREAERLARENTKETDQVSKSMGRHFSGHDYVAQYRNDDEAKALKIDRKSHRLTQQRLHDVNDSGSCSSSSEYDELCLSDIDRLTEASDYQPLSEMLHDESVGVYQKYNFTHRTSNKSEIAKHKSMILDMVDNHPVSIVKASTGSGKSSQLPQFILDHHMELKRHCNIVVTQPRRIAALTVAKFVCSERNLQLGGLVGYQVGLDNNTTTDTRLSYVTTGVLLKKLLLAKHLNDYTHVIIDEVHERDANMDFLILLVRKLLRHVSPATKVILMSATFDVDLFANYFSVVVDGVMRKAEAIEFHGKAFKTHLFYVEELQRLGELPELDYSKPCISVEAINLCKKLIVHFDKLEIAEQKVKNSEFAPVREAVLVFLPGIEEIRKVYNVLEVDIVGRKWTLIPLHSTVSKEDQSKAFERPQPGFRKIILATNIAESSITVTDIIYVIDFCLTKNQVCDPHTRFTSLHLEWASVANCDQRKGRAGRVKNGRVYRLVTKDFFKDFQQFGAPEMQRGVLDKVVLDIKMLNMGEPKAILALAMDPPDLQDIESTILTLLEVGALAAFFNEDGITSSHDGDLTYVGRVMSNLPIDVHLGKLIVLGHAFGCLDECIVIAAALNHKSIFTNPYVEQLDAYKHKMSWADGSFSDCIAALNVYWNWQKKRESNYFKRPGAISEWKWGERYFVQINRLIEMQKLVVELTQRLNEMNIVSPTNPFKPPSPAESNLLLKIVLAGAFYPNYFTQAPLDEAEVAQQINGRDVYNTVKLGGLPIGVSSLYSEDIAEGLKCCGTLETTYFESSTSHAYVCFKKSHHRQEEDEFGTRTNSKIAAEVYFAIKKRLLRMPITIKLFSNDETKDRLRLQASLTTNKFNGMTTTNRVQVVKHINSPLPLVEMPDLSMSSVELRVSHFVDCGHFWAQYADRDHKLEINTLRRVIEQHMRIADQTITCGLVPGMLVLAPFQDDGTLEYYRAIVEKVTDRCVEVLFVDFGNTEEVRREQLRAIDGAEGVHLLTCPKQAFECILSNIRPSVRLCPNKTWSKEAKKYFQDALNDVIFIGRVYSVVHDVMRLEVIYKPDGSTQVCLNDQMVKKGFAEVAEEDIQSKKNNELRCQARVEDVKEFCRSESTITNYIQPPSGRLRRGNLVSLKGPSSPLEMNFLGLTRSTSAMAIRIEQDSVNSVSLDPEPQDKLSRLIVASDMNLNTTKSQVTARSTTLFPNIHGLIYILSIIFSPRVEFRTDRARTKYIGALCGLGCEQKTKKSIFPEHEMELTFDVKFTTDDIIMINEIRIGLNLALGSKNDPYEDSPLRMFDIQKRLQKNVLRIVRVTRDSMEPQQFEAAFNWRKVRSRDVILPDLNQEYGDCMHVLPLLNAIALRTPEEAHRKKMEAHVKELHHKANRSTIYQAANCKLCNENVTTPFQLLKHLNTPRHKDLEYMVFRDVKSATQS